MKIAVLGSTGVIGTLSLEIAEKNEIEVIGLAAGRNIHKLRQQIEKFRPRVVAVSRREDALALGENVLWGQEGLKEVATLPDADLVVIAVSGTAGILPMYEAVKAGKRVALANKESLVSGGCVIMEEARKNRAEIIPVDSEHNSLFQLFLFPEKPEKIILTASGGPFFKGRPSNIGINDVLSHPVWNMGKKITVDSATLMNKAFEMVEAKWLFGLSPDRIGVLIHPQSIVHSIVVMKDGSQIAHMSVPDMRIPIQYALLYPGRALSPTKPLNLAEVNSLEFYEAPPEKYPAIGVGYRMLREAPSLSAIINGANDAAVMAFLEGKIKFSSILDVIIEISKGHAPFMPSSIEEVIDIVQEGAERAEKLINKRN